MKKLWTIFMLALIAAVFVGCSNLEDDDHYKVPDWLKGNAYEVLQKDGNYSTFLRGVDLTGNQGVVSGKSLLTVVAPDNDAFSTFLQAKGYGSIDEMYQAEPQYVKNLIGMHLMYFAFDWDKMVNFRPSDGDAATDEAKEKNAGYYYKHRTRSQDEIETIVDRNNEEKKIYHYERYLPVFSNKLFESKKIDAASNYTYFYPNTQWYGQVSEGDGFNIANALVSDNGNVITDNGYLYHVNKVIEPLNTIYDELCKNQEFSQFRELYDSYLTYVEVPQETAEALGYTAYLRNHGSDLMPIAYEWPIDFSKYNPISQLAGLESAGYNIFAPTNDALNDFFHTFWKPEKGYTHIMKQDASDKTYLDPLISRYFIMQMFSRDKFIVFPEEIASGNVKTTYNTTVNFNPYNIAPEHRKICNNGVLYGMDKMEAPAIFSSVAGPAFSDSNYRIYLYTLDGSGLVPSLAADNSRFVTLIPSNAQCENSDPAMRLYETTSGNMLQEFSSTTGQFEEMTNKSRLAVVNLHTTDAVDELPTAGKKVVPTYSPFTYWYVKDGQITTNVEFAQMMDYGYTGTPFVDFHEITNNGAAWSNGKSYSYDAAALYRQQSGDGLLHKLANMNDKNYEYFLFAQLLKLSGLATGGTIKFPTDDGSESDRRVAVFAPTNEAIIAGIKNIPGSDKLTATADGITGTPTAAQKAELQEWLLRCFFSTEENGSTFTDYPFVGSPCKGSFVTKALTSNLVIEEKEGRLYVKFAGSNEDAIPVIDKYDGFPFAFTDGCLHYINGILK